MNTDLTILFQAVNALGIIGLLGFMVTAYHRGDPRKALLTRWCLPNATAVARRSAFADREAISTLAYHKEET